MAEVVLKKVCKFLQNQEDQEAIFKTFWEGTRYFYPSGQSKTKLKAWLKGHSESFKIIKSETGDPFGKIKLKVEAPSYDLPDTTWAEDFEITQALITSIDNKTENGHLYAIICKNKALIFPEILQDKKQIRKWLEEHERRFKMVKNASGGLYSVEVLDEGRNLSKCDPLLPPVMRPNKERQSKGTPHTETEHETEKLLMLAGKIVQRISEKIKNEGMTFPFESLLKEKAIIDPINDATALNDFLAAYPMKFEIIDIDGLGRWVHLKDGGTVGKNVQAKEAACMESESDVVSNVASFICENGGTISFVNLAKKAPNLLGQTVNSEETLSAWLDVNAKTFKVLRKPGDPTKPWQVKVNFGFSPQFCHNYVTHGQCQKKNCQFLHICKNYVCQQCHEVCKLSHNIRDAHNKMIIDKMGLLSKETDTVVVNVLLKSCFPRVCTDYNKNGKCPRGEACYFLHICGNYVLNKCSACPLNHNIVDSLHNVELLKKYALHPSQKMSEEIVKANIASVEVKKPQSSQFAELEVGIPRAPGVRNEKILPHRIAEEKVKKRSRQRRRKMSDKPSCNADESSLAETDLTGEIHHSLIDSSCHDSNLSLLSFKNIQKGNLATSLTGNEKVNKWMGSPATESDQVSNETSKHLDSSSSSEASYISRQSSIVSSQSSMWKDDLQKQVFITILEKYEGNVPFKVISKDRNLFGHNTDAEKWFEEHSQKFIFHRNRQRKIDTVSVFSNKARVCLDYGGKRGCAKPTCGFFHICRDHVEGCCPHGDSCSRNHDISSDEITQTANRARLQDLTKRQLFTLIQVSCPSVCHYHNQGKCNRGQFCPNLHVCKAFAKGRRFCKEKPCKYGHEKALQENPARNILKRYRLYGKKPDLKYIRKMIFVFDAKKHGQHGSIGKHHDVPSKGRETAEPRVGLMDVDLTKTVVDSPVQNFQKASGPEEATPNICVQFLNGHCHIKKCSDIHFGLPYCWQFRLQNKSGSWCNFDETDCENLEKYFCDVKCTAAELNVSTKIKKDASNPSVRVNFKEMSAQLQVSPIAYFEIRRLECLTESSFKTKWLWYKLESSKWMQSEDNRASVIEELFSEGKLAIDSLTQRRRPLLQNQENKRNIPNEQMTTQESPVSSQPPQLTPVPVVESIPLQASQCLRTRVEPGSQDYKNIEELLRSSSGLVIKQIEKIVSDDLWEKYKSKKKSMTDELKPGENLNYRNNLFVPCRYEDLERIMKGNIKESRISLPNQPLDRYYFTSDALFCVQKCREINIDPRYLIVCQVLLGTYTKDLDLGLDEFPRRPDGRIYDSLVDKMDNPCIFVIKDVDQCYPAYIIDFSYVISHAVEEPMLRGFEVVEGNYGLAATPQLNYPQSPPAYDQVPRNPFPTYAAQSSSMASVTPQQQPLSRDVPTPNYVKASPVHPERPAVHAEPPPDYTPPTRPDLPHPENVRQFSNIGQMPVSRTFRDFKEKKDNCVMM